MADIRRKVANLERQLGGRDTRYRISPRAVKAWEQLKQTDPILKGLCDRFRGAKTLGQRQTLASQVLRRAVHLMDGEKSIVDLSDFLYLPPNLMVLSSIPDRLCN